MCHQYNLLPLVDPGSISMENCNHKLSATAKPFGLHRTNNPVFAACILVHFLDIFSKRTHTKLRSHQQLMRIPWKNTLLMLTRGNNGKILATFSMLLLWSMLDPLLSCLDSVFHRLDMFRHLQSFHVSLHFFFPLNSSYSFNRLLVMFLQFLVQLIKVLYSLVC